MRNISNIFFKLNFWILILIAAQVAAIIFLCLYIPAYMPLALALAIVWLLAAASATLLFARAGTPEIKCVWFVVIAAVPVAGALIYLIASVKPKPHAILNVTDGAAEGLSAAAHASCGTCETGYSHATYFSSGTEFWNSALTAIGGAKKSVYIEFFIIGSGHLFNSVLGALKRAKDNGADIKVIFDGLGSAFKFAKRDLKKLKSVAEVKVFHKLTPFPNAKINLRDHRKIIAIDGKIAYTGGINLADEYINIRSPFGYWKDTGIAVYGGAAKVFEGMFLSMWQRKYEMPAPPPDNGGKTCLPYYDSPHYRAFCEDALVNAICAAEKRVHIFTPYFCVSDKTAAALAFTARRGVDVKVIIPHIPDKKYAFAVTKAFAYKMKVYGVKFYRYTPGFMHAKSVVCDDKAFLGSYNFDFRSTRFNYECGVAFDGGICDEVERDFQECLALSNELAECKPSRAKRFGRFVLRFFAPLV